jgi:hypothetical protein
LQPAGRRILRRRTCIERRAITICMSQPH